MTSPCSPQSCLSEAPLLRHRGGVLHRVLCKGEMPLNAETIPLLRCWSTRGWFWCPWCQLIAPGCWGQERLSRTGSPSGDRAQPLSLALSAYSAKGRNGRWGKTVMKESKNKPYQMKQKCFQFLSGKERLDMTSSQHSLILFCYNHYIEPSNPLCFPDWQTLSEHLNPESLGHPLPSSLFKLWLLFFSSLFLNHSLPNSCFSH